MWYMIPGFNGYEINEDKIVRSMKMHTANPGHLIKLYHSDGVGYYILSDNHCKRVRKTQDELWELVEEQKRNYPNQVRVRADNHVYLGSRNTFRNDYPEESPVDHKGGYYMDFSKWQK